VVLGFCSCGPLRLNISPKKTEKVKLTWIAYHTLQLRISEFGNYIQQASFTLNKFVIKKNDKFAFKGDKSKVVRRTFWLIKVVPTWKKFEKRSSSGFPTHNLSRQAAADPHLRPRGHFDRKASFLLAFLRLFGDKDKRKDCRVVQRFSSEHRIRYE
jgi:hypothetical protein